MDRVLRSPRLTLSLSLALTLMLWAARPLVSVPVPLARLEGAVTWATSTMGGGQMVRVEGRSVLIAPQLGTVPRLARGDRIRVAGFERAWRGRTFLIPTSRAHVERVRLTLAEAMALPKGASVALVARAEGVEPFTSRAGKRHLRFTVVDGERRCAAIMYEGSYGPREQALLAAGGTLRLSGRMDVFRGQPSLVVRQVE